MTLLLIFLGLGVGYPRPALAQNLPPVVYSTTTAEDILRAYAVKYAINGDEFVATARCESQFDEHAIGDHGTSFGVFQLHLPAHPEITKAEALDALWSVDWAAKQFVAYKQYMWTCYRSLYK